jgi:hypothetical protein
MLCFVPYISFCKVSGVDRFTLDIRTLLILTKQEQFLKQLGKEEYFFNRTRHHT